ncbi:MAG: SPOR domain-containing protein [Oligoflexia bacterium]|nr:SPOR domain-containing protein [Oligoflexia bacterium]
MDEKNRVFIFDKKELALIFVFMILIAITSFAFGVKIGKSFSLQKGGISFYDKEKVDLKSIEEERMDDVTKKMMVSSREEIRPNVDKTYKKLEEEFEKINRVALEDGPQTTSNANEKIARSVSSIPSNVSVTSSETANITAANSAPNNSVNSVNSVNSNNNIAGAGMGAGKYTIQIGSYQLESDAMKFADGFRVRGYNPILSEVRIPDKGVWYRVSLGSFNNISDAKDYINKEESLFQGQDYIITEFN